MKFILLVVSTLVLSSCISPELQMRLLKASGTVKFEVTDVEKEQAKITIVNKNDYEWNAELPTNRNDMVNQVLADKCISSKILSEKEINTGSYAQGRPMLTWAYSVQCQFR